ncbi:MAG: CoA transferase, partial [Verrucomicrobiae bacterium]|nr:CoA transferase [Verrucomicrobiae bacterium]
MTVYFANTHRNKKSLQLNLKTEEGRAIALDLAARCDVMIEAFRPG